MKSPARAGRPVHRLISVGYHQCMAVWMCRLILSNNAGFLFLVTVQRCRCGHVVGGLLLMPSRLCTNFCSVYLSILVDQPPPPMILAQPVDFHICYNE